MKGKVPLKNTISRAATSAFLKVGKELGVGENTRDTAPYWMKNEHWEMSDFSPSAPPYEEETPPEYEDSDNPPEYESIPISRGIILGYSVFSEFSLKVP
jgi:hypothetical protein